VRKLDNWLEAYIKYTSANEAPEPFHLWSGVWALSSVIQRKAWLDFAYYFEHPNFFIVLVGLPATHKSTACEIATKLLINVEGLEDSLGPDMTSIEALIAGIPSTESEFEYRGEIYKHQSIAISVPEFGSFIGEKDVTKCTNLCRLYDSAERFEKWTKSQGSDHLRNYFVTMEACSTAEQLMDHLPTGAIGGGLASRILYIVQDPDPDRENSLPSLPYSTRMLKYDLIDDLTHIATRIKGEFKISVNAVEFYDEWYKSRNKNKIILDPMFDHYYNRKPTHLLKLAMILSASRGDSMTISYKDLQNSLRMLNVAEPRMPEAFSGVGANPLLKILNTLMNLLRSKGKIHRNEINVRAYKLGTPKMIAEAIDQLVNHMEMAEEDGEYIKRRDY
jgi:hypothetical protein